MKTKVINPNISKDVCPKCGSTFSKSFLGLPGGCLNPNCENYYKGNNKMKSKETVKSNNIAGNILNEEDKNVIVVSANLKIDIDNYLIAHTQYNRDYIKSLKYDDKIKLLEIDLLSNNHIPEIKLGKFTEVTKDKRSIGGH